MGLLDDAIREHLDLKRRRGANPAEIERSEREALGPVRRNRDPVAGPLPDGSPAADAAWDEPDEGVAADVADTGETGAVSPGDHWVDTAEEPPGEQGEDWSLTGERAGSREREFADEAPPPPRLRFDTGEEDEWFAETPRSAGSHVGEETTEFSVQEALAAEERAAAGTSEEDMLEETPEFLQDTPDHDRLWFEQRPPRDFDFDG